MRRYSCQSETTMPLWPRVELAKGNVMELLGWIGIGLLAGALARLIMPGRDPGGCIVTILLGIAGALLAGYVGRIAGFYAAGEQAGFIAAVLGSIAVLALYRFFARRA